MSYTLEQKIEARAKGELWWRFPIPKFEENKQWSRPNILHITSPVAIYFIGPTPPRVRSELEGELLEALNELLIDMRLAQTNMRAAAKRDPAWEGCAEAIQPRVDAAIAAIKKAESTP